MLPAEFERQLQQAILFAREGQRQEAYQILQRLIKENPRSSVAWLWLATVAENQGERIHALQQVLELDPDNLQAWIALEKLDATLVREIPRPQSSREKPEPAPFAPVQPPSQPVPANPMSNDTFFWGVLIFFVVTVIVVIAVLLIADNTENDEPQAASTATATSTPSPTITLIPATPTDTPIPIPTDTPLPNNTLPPSWTPLPTITLAPTQTLVATWTPIPSRTPLPTRMPEPLPVQVFGG